MGKLILYHHDCWDGLAAAWMARKSEEWKDAIAQSVRYDQGIPLSSVKGQDVLILDFCYPRHELEAIAREANSLAVIDHHPQAKEVQDLPYVTYSDRRSGCGMVLDSDGEWLSLDQASKDAIDICLIIEDRDLWKFDFEATKFWMAYLDMGPKTFDALDHFEQALRTPKGKDHCVRAGKAALQHQASVIDLMLQRGMFEIPFTTKGCACAAINSPVLESEIGQRLRDEGYSVAVIFYVKGDSVKFSLRGNGQVDVGQLAKLYGGGGHKNAAGFSTDKATANDILNRGF